MENLTNQPVQSIVNNSTTITEDYANKSVDPQLKTENLNMKKISIQSVAIAIIVVLIAGLTSGWVTFGVIGNPIKSKNNTATQLIPGNTVSSGDIFGSDDLTKFPDNAEGFLQVGGINGEGSHKLIRSGGESRTVYLTSTVTDLNKLVNMQVKVWGETYKGQSAGWLMDVGRVEVLDPNAVAPKTSD